ncbi:MAG: hypothetical protein SP4CHLAM5_03770 [Chlamydiia bacterium]|nr:hypothetical protein [Chlamydiia bacterium]MCH9618251.1 hypothetical protein [Chlamydiia bacterium]MCH9624647.1 hypothetical protein [Chlamydiia bacterium]
MLHKILSVAILATASTNLIAYDSKIAIAKETKLVQKQNVKAAKPSSAKKSEQFKNYKPFTAKVLGEGVRLRLNADVESPILSELSKHELLIVKGEKESFYAVEAPSDMKVYIFRSFVLDGLVEGNRVNVRLQPDLTSPVVGYLSTGDRVDGEISKKNHKWLEFTAPNNIHFFVAKEYLEKAGGPELKALHDEKLANLKGLVKSANLLAQAEMLKSFKEIDFNQVTSRFTEILNDYSEFTKEIAPVRNTLAKLQEDFLQKKLAFLENKAMALGKSIALGGDSASIIGGQTALTSSDRMKLWSAVEESLFVTWSAAHFNKTMNDFYEQEKLASVKISGIVEAYHDSVCNKPGNYIIRGDKDLPRAYVYSTMVDLHNLEGQYVTLIVAPRPNNNFAFPAYFAMEVE